MTLKQKNELAIELALIVVVVGLTCLTYRVPGVKMVVLNLYFLPVILGAFFLGRYKAGVLALLSVVLVTIIAAQDFNQFAAFRSPLTSALAITIWGGVLGLTTILAGTLSDERSTQMTELHSAHLGVIEVLTNYLYSIHPQLKERPARIAELSRQMAVQLQLTSREVDDIRIATLLQELDHIEVTARVARQGAGKIESDLSRSIEYTFHGADLVQSLGGVISGTLPLLRRIDDAGPAAETEANAVHANPPLGAQIIRTARTYDRLVHAGGSAGGTTPGKALEELRGGLHGKHLPEVVQALAAALAEADAQQPARTEPAIAPVAGSQRLAVM